MTKLTLADPFSVPAQPQPRAEAVLVCLALVFVGVLATMLTLTSPLLVEQAVTLDQFTALMLGG